MSRSFPARPPRSEFGPRPIDKYPVRSPQSEMGADIGHMMLAQVVGSGLLSALAELDVTIQSGAPTVTINTRKEAWNPDGLSTGDYADPTVLRTGTGVFTVEYSSQLPDQFGVLQDVVFRGGFASVVSANANVTLCEVKPTVPPSSLVTVNVWQFVGAAAPAAVDGKVNLRLW